MKTYFILLLTLPVLASGIKDQLIELAKQDGLNVSRFEVSHLYIKDNVPENAIVDDISTQPALGLVSFEVRWRVKEKWVSSMGSAYIKAFTRVAIAKVPIKTQEYFSEANTEFQERDISKIRYNGFFSDPEILFTMRAKGYLSNGTVISTHQAEQPYLISVGSQVDLINETPYLKITARVKALENGRMGSWIRLENSNTKKIITGKVIGPSLLSMH